MSDNEKAIVGCVSSIWKRLLCTCNPTCTSDFKREVKRMQVDHSEGLDAHTANVGSASPGLVARLMGLESMPEPSLVPKYRPIDYFLPRRSADSIYHNAKFDPIMHRQVGTSSSFRDLPTYCEDDVKEFLIVREENIWEKKIHVSKEGKHKINGREAKDRTRSTKRKEKQVLNQTVHSENDYMRMLVTGRPVHIAKKNDSRKHMGSSQGKIHSNLTASDRITFPKKHTGRSLLTKDRAESRREPLRVKLKSHTSAKEISRGKCSNLDRKQKPDFRNVKCVNSKPLSGDRCAKLSKSVCCLKSKKDARKLAYNDLERLVSKTREMWKQVNKEEIGTELGASILDGLVHEVVTELLGVHLNHIA